MSCHQRVIISTHIAQLMQTVGDNINVNKTNLYKPGAGIVPDVIKEIKPIYAGLTKDDDLAKCLHGITTECQRKYNCFVLATCPKKYLLWN